MAITDPVAIAFSDQNIRVAADMIAQLDNAAAAILSQWTALGGSALIPNTSAVLQDSASPNGTNTVGGDGRPGITGAMCNNIINRITEIRSTTATTGLALGSNGVRTTVLQVAVHPTR